MSEDDGQDQIDESKREASEEFGSMEGKADEMEERLDEHESSGEDVEVPEPGQGEDLSISAEEDKEAAGVADEDSDESEDEDESSDS